jgi:hypothetical protein
MNSDHVDGAAIVVDVVSVDWQQASADLAAKTTLFSNVESACSNSAIDVHRTRRINFALERDEF